MQRDTEAPKSVEMISKRNVETVNRLEVWDEVLAYDDIQQLNANVPTVIVDMSETIKC